MTATVTSNGHEPTGERVRQLVADHGGNISAAEVARQLGIKERTASYHTRKLAESGNNTSKTAIAVEPSPATRQPAPPVAVRQRRRRRAPAGMRLCVAAVAVAGAVWSAAHVIDLADQAGAGWLAYLAPVFLDGLAVASIYALVVTRTTRLVSVLGIAVGLVGTVAMNVISVWPGLVDMQHVAAGLAVIPPVAIATCAHIVIQASVDR